MNSMTREEWKKLTPQEKKRIYYKENKEKLKMHREKYYNAHRDEINEKMREYSKKHYQENKEYYRQYEKKRLPLMREKMTCECGAKISKNGFYSHKKSQKHQDYYVNRYQQNHSPAENLDADTD